MKADDHNPEPDELPGVRWLGAAHEILQRVAPDSRFRAAADAIVERVRPAPPSQALRDRVEAGRTRMNRPLRAAAPPPAVKPEAPAESHRQPEPSEGRGLDPAVRRRIETLLRVELPVLRIHTGQDADSLARRHNADAVTVRRDTYFRQGAFDPATPNGMGLLAHEATHVAWDAGARSAGRPGAAAADVEERAALANERRVLRGDPGPAATAQRGPQPAMPPAAPETSPAVKTALASRDLTEAEAPARPAELSTAQIRGLQDDIYRTLLDKLRSDFERGA